MHFAAGQRAIERPSERASDFLLFWRHLKMFVTEPGCMVSQNNLSKEVVEPKLAMLAKPVTRSSVCSLSFEAARNIDTDASY